MTSTKNSLSIKSLFQSLSFYIIVMFFLILVEQLIYFTLW